MTVRFALPSKGSLYDGTLAFLESCGLKVSRPNPRRYTASIRGLPDTDVLLHRPTDIVEKVAEGEIDLGISGLDLVEELRGDRDDLLVLFEDLGFGAAELVVAVPETWIDVTSPADLADLAVELHGQGRPLRIATKYPALVRHYCHANQITYFRLIDSQGATEAAPGLGYADIIADITETGTTLRDNQLKIVGEPLLRSQACLIGSRRNLQTSPKALEAARTLLEMVEARRRARRYVQVTANVAGSTVADVGRRVTARPDLSGMQGPTIAPVWAGESDGNHTTSWFMVTLVVPQERVLALVDHLRTIGGNGIAVTPAQYVFEGRSESYARLLGEIALSVER
jgi:ATP phosphoribosyltransferase